MAFSFQLRFKCIEHNISDFAQVGAPMLDPSCSVVDSGSGGVGLCLVGCLLLSACVMSPEMKHEMSMDLMATVAEHNGQPQWREQVQFLRDFQMQKWFSMRGSTIDQIVQQE